MAHVVVVGGGWAGSAAAIAARKAGVTVTLLERTDALLGTGLVGGIMRNNGRFTAAEEAIAMGFGDLFLIADACARHKNIEFPGHKHATLYDVARIEPEVRKFLEQSGVEVHFEQRVTKAEMEDHSIKACVTEKGQRFEGDVFVDCTGSAGPQVNCTKYGNGCCMCILRCPSFGGRVSLTSLAGVKEMVGTSHNGRLGSMSGSCKIFKESLSRDIVNVLDRDGVCVVKIPEDLGKKDLSFKACQQYALQEYAENVILLDTGHAKLMASFFPLEKLRMIPGFENARFEDPYAGGKGNSVRYMAIAPRDNALRVSGVTNLFCGGEKAGTFVGHTEAIVTGSLAGFNAARTAIGQEPIVLPRETVIGDIIATCNEDIQAGKGLGCKYTFSGSVFFNRMKEIGTYSADIDAIHSRVKSLGLGNLFGLNWYNPNGERR